jgi:enediyne biosynthesis protein E4
VTVLPREIYSLYHNEGGGNFNYASLEAGLGALTSMSSGWGVGLEDFDNDGWKDLFVAQGHVLDNVQDIDASLRYKELPLIALNHKGRFERADSGVTKPLAARGVAFGDINNDGCMDAVISCLGGPPVLLLNRGGGGNHWLSISLQGTRSNRDGFGSRVSVNGQTRVTTSTGSYLCANDKRLHFGLGAAEKATVEILWPSGVKQLLNDVRADQFLSVREPERS